MCVRSPSTSCPVVAPDSRPDLLTHRLRQLQVRRRCFLDSSETRTAVTSSAGSQGATAAGWCSVEARGEVCVHGEDASSSLSSPLVQTSRELGPGGGLVSEAGGR